MKKGITLLEIIIVMAIFALLAGLMLANIRRGDKSQKLREAALTLVDDIRQAQNKTFVGESRRYCKKDDITITPPTYQYEIPCTPGVTTCEDNFTCTSVVPPGGYGMYFNSGEKDQYIIFGDFGDAEIKDQASPEPVVYSPGIDPVVSTVMLGTELQIADVTYTYPIGTPTGITCNADTTPSRFSTGSISFVWTQPNGALAIKPAGTSTPCPDAEIKIVLQQTAINSCRTITVNGTSGLVDEEVTTCP